MVTIKCIFVRVGCNVTALFVNVMLDYFWTFWSHKHGRLLSITWTFPVCLIPILCVTFSRFETTTVAWHFFLFLPSKLWQQTHAEHHPVWMCDGQGVQQLPSLLLWHWGLRARPSKCWRHLHLCALQRSRRGGRDGRDGENKVIGLPAPFSMTHHENKSAGGPKLSHSP